MTSFVALFFAVAVAATATVASLYYFATFTVFTVFTMLLCISYCGSYCCAVVAASTTLYSSATVTSDACGAVVVALSC